MELGAITTYQAGVYQTRGFRALRQLKNKALEPHGLTMMEWLVLGLIKDAGANGIRITNLATELDTTQAFITNTVNVLEKKKFVARKADKSDKRAHCVVFNKKYLLLIDKIEAELRDKLRETLYAKVTPEELKTYMNVVIKFSKSS